MLEKSIKCLILLLYTRILSNDSYNGNGVYAIQSVTGCLVAHVFGIKAVGGQAIVKIKPPNPSSASSKISANMVDFEGKHSINPKDKLTRQPTAMQQVLKTHIDTLYEVLGGLKTADEEIKYSLNLNQQPLFSR